METLVAALKALAAPNFFFEVAETEDGFHSSRCEVKGELRDVPVGELEEKSSGCPCVTEPIRSAFLWAEKLAPMQYPTDLVERLDKLAQVNYSLYTQGLYAHVDEDELLDPPPGFDELYLFLTQRHIEVVKVLEEGFESAETIDRLLASRLALLDTSKNIFLEGEEGRCALLSAPHIVARAGNHSSAFKRSLCDWVDHARIGASIEDRHFSVEASIKWYESEDFYLSSKDKDVIWAAVNQLEENIVGSSERTLIALNALQPFDHLVLMNLRMLAAARWEVASKNFHTILSVPRAAVAGFKRRSAVVLKENVENHTTLKPVAEVFLTLWKGNSSEATKVWAASQILLEK